MNISSHDGGDRDIPVHYTQFDIYGFDPEDAIAQYRDDLGERKIKDTTRVAVYSPRFAAVSVIGTLESGVTIDRAIGAEVSEFGVMLNKRTATIAHEQNLGSERMRTRSRSSELDTDAWVTAVDVTRSTTDHNSTLNVFE